MNKKAQLCKHCKQVARHFEKDCFELKDNEERQPPNWKTRVEWNNTETKIRLGKQHRKVTKIANNISQSNAYSNYWSPITGLVEEPADNTYYDFSYVLQNKSSSGKPDPKAKSPPDPTEYQ